MFAASVVGAGGLTDFWWTPWCHVFADSPLAIGGAMAFLAGLAPLGSLLLPEGSGYRAAFGAALLTTPLIPLTANSATWHTPVTLLAGGFAVGAVVGVVRHLPDRLKTLSTVLLIVWGTTFVLWMQLLAGVGDEQILGLSQKLTTLAFALWALAASRMPPSA